MTRYYLPSFVGASAGVGPLLIKGETRPIYWRVTDGATHTMYSGVYRDLKTLRGASKRVRKAFPLWREIEVRFNPFGSN